MESFMSSLHNQSSFWYVLKIEQILFIFLSSLYPFSTSLSSFLSSLKTKTPKQKATRSQRSGPVVQSLDWETENPGFDLGFADDLPNDLEQIICYSSGFQVLTWQGDYTSSLRVSALWKFDVSVSKIMVRMSLTNDFFW